MPRILKAPYVNAVVPPISVSSAYYFQDTEEFRRYKEGELAGGRYGRYDNPTWLEAQAQLALLEGAEAALIFPSGMSAVTNTVCALAQQGDSILYTGCAYRNLRTFFSEHMSRFGVHAHAIDQAHIEQFNAEFSRLYDPKTCSLVFIEMPSNPHMYLVDIDHVRSVIDPKRTKIVVDSTFASPENFQPLYHGADLVLHSCTKYLGGHGDFLAGCVCGDTGTIEKIQLYRNVSGAVSDGMSAFLLSRSLSSLPVRMAHFNKSGLEIATALEANPLVSRVYYTGLKSHPHAALAQKYLSGHGGVLSFELDCDKDEVMRFVDALEVPFMGTNFGSHHAMVEQCAEFTYYKLSDAERADIGITDTLVRMTIGLHDPALILDDIDRALKIAKSTPGVVPVKAAATSPRITRTGSMVGQFSI
ncbi:aminotransferase class I/II-fold pyridoxal phosphate-dependent enzyme [Acetobacter orientalis]|uniref:aminotransferase class I/II-fold pyridoxal phosphate-dependent enzyme n=1 Tax=Acetobacter orientalis TaxID=146474 RepID=UPI0039EC4945